MQDNNKSPSCQEKKRAEQVFYDRLAVYRLLEQGITSIRQLRRQIEVPADTLLRWKRTYDPRRGPYGSTAVPLHPNELGCSKEAEVAEATAQECPDAVFSVPASERQEILSTDGLPADTVSDRLKVYPPLKTERQEILAAMRDQALGGNVPAAKLLLSEYEERPAQREEELTVERAVELIREWVK